MRVLNEPMSLVLNPPFKDLAPPVKRRHRHARTADAREAITSGLAGFPVRWLPLGALLAIQAFLSYRLIRANTAFLDEATYLSAGHQLLHAWIHGGPNMAYETYFSGAPVIYPVIGALFDSVGGLAAARLFSLALMLATTVFAYASARRLGGTVAAWFSAAVFVCLQGTQYLGAFATFDAMALFLIALASWIVIRSAFLAEHVPVTVYWAAPVLVFANATKYASALFDPVVVVIALLVVAARFGWRAGLRCAGILAALTVALASALLALAGSGYWAGVTSTTTNRSGSDATVHLILADTFSWIGAIIVLSALGAVVLVIMALRGRITLPYALLAVALFGATLLAPANQARIHTATSLSKHVNYGAWFGALLAGYFLSCVVGRGVKRSWRYLVALPVVALMLVAGTTQAHKEFGSWINTTSFIRGIRPVVMHSRGPVLMDDVSVPTYYLGAGIDPTRWVSTFYFHYDQAPGHPPLSGIPAYTKAIHQDYFTVIALDWGDERPIDGAISKAITENHSYHFVGKYASYHSRIKSSYVVWRLQTTGGG